MKIVWGKDKLFIIDEIQPKRVQQAIELVESAIQGKIGFCWRSVPKVPLHGSFEINNKIVRRERALMCETSERIVPHIRDEIQVLKQKAKEFILFDSITEKKLKRNYHQLNRALILLSSEGIIGSYTLLSTGRLSVAWFESWEKPVIIEIKQGFTCTYSTETLAVKTRSEIVSEGWPSAVWPNEAKGIVGNIGEQGVVNKPYEGNTDSGPVGIDSTVLRYRQSQDTQIPKLKEVSKLLEGLEPKDIIRYMAYLMYMKKRWKIENS